MDNIIFKKVETNSEFQKVKADFGNTTLTNSGLTFTYCDLDDLDVRPYGNLFMSFNFPITSQQRQAYNLKFKNTGLENMLNVRKAVVIDIPSDKYGEIIDGKNIDLKVLVKSGGTDTLINCYSSFYNFNGNLNNQISDSNSFSGWFGSTPDPNNNYNSNIAYLFSNEIAKPKDTLTTTTILQSGFTFSSNPNAISYEDSEVAFSNARASYSLNDGVYKATYAANLTTGVTYHLELLSGKTLSESLNIINIKFTHAGSSWDINSLIVPNSIIGNTFKLSKAVTEITIENNTNSPITGNIVLSSLSATSTKNWSAWSASEKFPQSVNGSGKAFARFNDPNYNLMIDEPVGIVYLDKGFIVLTHPTIVDNFVITSSTVDYRPKSSGYDGFAVNATYTGSTSGFTKIWYETASNVQLKVKSYTHEFIQNITCLALPNEFYNTNNPTFNTAYAGGVNDENDPVFVTEVGLYNKYGELIAIAKTSEPIEKNKLSVAMFNIKLKL